MVSLKYGPGSIKPATLLVPCRAEYAGNHGGAIAEGNSDGTREICMRKMNGGSKKCHRLAPGFRKCKTFTDYIKTP